MNAKDEILAQLQAWWDNGTPVKERQILPAGTLYMRKRGGLLFEKIDREMTVNAWWASEVRLVEPVPEKFEPPLVPPAWLDAPAVLADHYDIDTEDQAVWSPSEYHEPDEGMWHGCGITVHWSNLKNVTPLYPKGS